MLPQLEGGRDGLAASVGDADDEAAGRVARGEGAQRVVPVHTAALEETPAHTRAAEGRGLALCVSVSITGGRAARNTRAPTPVPPPPSTTRRQRSACSRLQL